MDALGTSALEASAAGILIADARAPGRPLVYVNPALAAMTGYEASELLGRDHLVLLGPDPDERVLAELRRAEGEEHGGRVTMRLVRKDGSAFFAEETLSPLRDAGGAVTHLVGVVVDVSDRRAVEAALREGEERFRRAFDSAPIGMTLTAPDGRLLSVNRAFCAMLGYEREELVRLNWQDVTHPEDREENRALQERMLAGEIESFELEKRYVARDGHPVWVRLVVSLVRNAAGTPLYSIAQVQDVTEERRTLAALKRRDAVLSAVAASAERLLRARDLSEVIDSVLRELGTSTEASRCYLFENHSGPDGRPLTSRRYEWCAEGVEPQLGRAGLENIPLDDPQLAEWRAALETSQPCQIHVRDLPEPRRSALAAQGIRSLLTVPISVEGRWWGFIGFDDCETERQWSAAEVDALRAAAGALAAAIHRRRADESRREAEERHRLLVESLPLVTYVDRADDRVSAVYISPQIEAILGYSPEEWLRDPDFFRRVLHPDDVARAYAGPWPEGPGPHVYEYRLIARDGRAVWFHDQYVLVRAEDGTPLYSQGFMIDISERKQAEEELRRRDAVLAAVAAAAERLLAAADWEEVIGDVLAQLGRAAGVSRAYVFERRAPAGGDAVLVQRCEWAAPGVEPQIGNERLQAVPLGAPGFRELAEELEAGGIVQSHTRHLSGALREELEAEGVLSVLLVPIFVGDRWWGVCGFDECAAERVWGPAEIEPVRTAAGTLGSAIGRWEAEAGRREAEERYRALVEHLPFVTYVSDLRGGPPSYVSPQIEGMFGYPLERWLGEPFFLGRVAHEDDLPSLAARLDPDGDAPVTTELRVRAAVGRTVWVRDTFLVVRDAEGRPLYGQGFMIDVTERRQMEEALRETNETLQTLVDASPIAIVVLDLDDRVRLWSEAAAATYGWTAEEVLGELLPTRPAGLEHEYRLFRETALRGSRIAGFETRRLRKDGRLIDVSISLAPLRDSEGRVVGVLGAHVDITEAKRAERALRERERQFRAVFDSSLNGLVIVDDERRIIEVNEAGAELYGLPRAELIGRALDELVPPDQQGALEELWRTLVQQGRFEREWELVRPDGARRSLELTGQASFLPGRHLVRARDVTQRKALEQQLLHSQRMDAVGRLAGGIAHDFNNLLTAIQGYSDFLLSELPKGSEPWRDAEQIARASERAEALVRQLLAFGRKQMLQPEVIDLNAVVRDIDSMLQRLIGEDIALELDLDPALASIHADASQIEQVVINLAVNAREAMPDGGSLRIRTGNTELEHAAAQRLGLDPGRYVALVVEDTGIGMDEATRLRAFEPFFTTKEQGTGLGLSTVYGIVAQSGGEVEAESAPGMGARFSAYFPAVERADRRPEPVGGAEAAADGGSGTVLLVEDEAVVRALAERILSAGGYRVLEAGSGEEALRVAGAHEGRIDLLLTDVVMPGMSGCELAERLLELRPGTRVLYMSGYTEDAVIRRGVSGERSFLAKPFTPAELVETVRLALETPPASAL